MQKIDITPSIQPFSPSHLSLIVITINFQVLNGYLQSVTV